MKKLIILVLPFLILPIAGQTYQPGVYKEPVCDVEVSDSSWMSLEYAVTLNCIEIIQTRLEAGVDPEEINNPDDLLLMHAMNRSFHRTEIIKLLLAHGANPNLIDKKSRDTPISLAIRHGNIVTIKIFIDNGADVNILDANNESPLHTAVLWKNTQIVKLLLSSGADVHGAGGYPPIIIAPNMEIYNILIKAGASPYTKGPDGRTCLMGAAAFGDVKIITELLRLGLEVNAQDDYGITPLMYAINSEKEEKVKLLLEHGADVSIVSKYGETAMKIAKRRKIKKIELLLRSYKKK